MTSLIVPQKDKSLTSISLGVLKAVFFKLGNINVYHKLHKMAPVAPLPCMATVLDPVSVINQIYISPFAAL